MFCRKCGKKLADDSVFCPKCGTKILKSDREDDSDDDELDLGLDDDDSDDDDDLDFDLDDDEDDSDDEDDEDSDGEDDSDDEDSDDDDLNLDDEEIGFKDFDWADDESVEYFTICKKEARGEYLTTSEFMKKYSSLVILGREQLMEIYEARILYENWLEYQEDWDSTNGIVDEIADYEKFSKLSPDMKKGPVELISKALHLISKIDDSSDDDEIEEIKKNAAECSYEAAATGNIMGLALAAYCALKEIGVEYNLLIAEHCADLINNSSFRKNHPDILIRNLIEKHCSGLSSDEVFDLAVASHSYVWLDESKLDLFG